MAKRFCCSEVLGGRGTRTSVPSQLMPAKPVETLSLTPSSTEVITTRAKTPSMRSVRVSSERSLCAHNSIRPPVTTSQTRERRLPRLRRRRGIPAVVTAGVDAMGDGVKIAVSIAVSFIAQRLHRRLPAGLGGRVEGEQEAEDDGQSPWPR